MRYGSMVESVSLSLSDTDIELHSSSAGATGWLRIASHTEARGYFEIKMFVNFGI